MSSFRAILTEHAIFSSLDRSQREILEHTAIARNYLEGAFVTYYGDIWPYLFVVINGKLNAVKESREGRSLIVSTFGTGDMFWGLAFFYEDAHMPVSLEVIESARLLLWSREQILPVIFANGRFSWELSRLMVERMQHASAMVEELAFQPLTGRVARLLLEQFPTSQDIVPRHLTLDEMASRVGTTREMVCRILYRFAEAGAIQINRTEFVFTDRGILDEFSKNTS